MLFNNYDPSILVIFSSDNSSNLYNLKSSIPSIILKTLSTIYVLDIELIDYSTFLKIIKPEINKIKGVINNISNVNVSGIKMIGLISENDVM